MDYQFDENYRVKEDHLGTCISHPAFGTIAFYKSHKGNYETLFGSSIKHRDTITCCIRHADVTRGLNNDWYHAKNDIIEIELSYTQFVEAITNIGSGTGIPCTLRYTEKDGRLPKCHYIDKYTEFQDEFREHLDQTSQEASQFLKELADLFQTKKSIGKQDRELILKRLTHLLEGQTRQSDFTLQQFQEQMDKTVTEAKGELESFLQNKMIQLASQSLLQDTSQTTPIDVTQLLPETTQKKEDTP